ncbi:MAG: hypothetical protein DRQ37_06465, partial [Gammaproteobacteria bacterium]
TGGCQPGADGFCDQDDPDVTMLFVGTNDGGFRMVNADTGVEHWIYYPDELLENQQQLRENNAGNHVYGIDGTAAAYVKDVDGDGQIEAGDGDLVHLYIGERRGGNELFAFDVTPTSAPTSPTGDGNINPVLMFRISGDSGSFSKIGQSWSRPRVAELLVGVSGNDKVELQPVVIFGGGYDEAQDSGFGTSAEGNAIYVVDAITGDCKLVISDSNPGGCDDNVVVSMDENGDGSSDMSYPIPSDLVVFDSDGDGDDNRIYFGDMGGQVWRVDLEPALGNKTGIVATVGKLAELSDRTGGAVAADERKVFYPPDVVQLRRGEFSDVYNDYDMVLVVTGNRAGPLGTTTTDRVYALRDGTTGSLPDADGNGITDTGYPKIGGALAETDLFDVTAVDDPGASALLRSSHGWFFDFTESGEKALASPVVLAGKLFFTTYLPEGVVSGSSCSLSEGSGRLYGVDILTGGALFNWDGVGDGDNLTTTDRHYQLGSGIPSSAVPVFQPEGVTLLIGGGSIATVDPDVDLPRERTYWYEE